MREKLNNNPLAQVALIGVLLIATGFFVLSSMGGGGEETGSAGTTTSPTATTPAGSATTTAAAPAAAAPAASLATALSPATAASSDAPLPPRPVLDAWKANRTLVLLFVRDGGIDDRLVAAATARLAALPGVAIFVVPARRISRYAAIAEGVGVNRVPALVVVRPKRLDHSVPTASVSYGFQSAESIVQAVVDAGYKGPTVDYHP